MRLEDIRKEIDIIDKKLILLIGERLRLVRKIKEIKKGNNIEIIDSARESEILDRIKNKAKIHDIDENFTEKIFRAIIEESRRVQER